MMMPTNTTSSMRSKEDAHDYPVISEIHDLVTINVPRDVVGELKG